jgi:hypothetical protein
MVRTLLMIVFNITAQNEQCAVESRQEDILVIVGANGNIIGHTDGFLAQQSAGTQFDKNENTAELIQKIHTVLQILTAFTVFLKAFKAGLCLSDGLLNLTFDQIK